MHHVDQLNHALVVNVVVDSIGVFFARQYTLILQNGQMLGYIALGGPYMLDDVLNTQRVIVEYA